MRLIALAAPALALASCAYPYPPPALAPVNAPAPALPATPIATARAATPVTILMSIDGFRPDYLDRGVTPNLNRLKAAGVSASMRPSFPSVTFPNHWTLVTGLRPDRTGIVANTMEDARRPGETFTMQTDDPFWWSEAEPVWVTAEKAGKRTATMFWPGANVAVRGVRSPTGHHFVTGGVRPSDWQQYNEAITGEQRVAAVLDWLRRPVATRPAFVTLYFDIVDTAGHDHGPSAPETIEAVATVDAQIGALVAGLAALDQPANLVIVADHGMAETSSSRTIALADLADPADMRAIETGPVASLVALPGREAAVARQLLRPRDHVRCWRKEAIPARLHYGRNPRVAPFVCLAAAGWTIVKRAPTAPYTGGAHGYDPADPAMAALFIASGPSFAAGKRIAAFDNVDIAPLLRDLIGLPAGRDLDGDDAPFRGVLKR